MGATAGFGRGLADALQESEQGADVIAGRREQLAGKIQERYGLAKDDVEKQLSRWESSADDSWFGIGKK